MRNLCDYNLSSHDYRLSLLPFWLKFTNVIVILYGAILIYALLFWEISTQVRLSAFGLETNKLFSFQGIWISSIIFIYHYASVRLFLLKNDALKIGKIAMLLGIITCIFSMVVQPVLSGTYSINFRLEIMILLFLYSHFKRIDKRW